MQTAPTAGARSILGIDPSLTKTGLAFMVDPSDQPKTIQTMSFASVGDVDGWCRQMASWLDDLEPDIVVFEAALDIIISHAVNGRSVSHSGQLLVNRLDGAIRGLCIAKRIDYQPVLPKTWRAWALGKGNLDRQQSKALARQRCQMIGIKINNIDEAEAALICLYGTIACKLVDLQR